MQVSIRFLFIGIIIFFSLNGWAQKESKMTLSGHVQNLNTVMMQNVSSEWHSMGSLDNRLNFKYYPHPNWTFTASARNQLTFGQLVYENHPYYADLLVSDDGYLNLTKSWSRDSSYVLYTNLDRANLEFSKGKFNVRVGRQRINWGINLVWNPNDIFNTFNFYDFDYVERPGCDAVRVQYYSGATSSFEGGFKMDADNKITSAIMYKFNRWNYDFQMMGGVMEDDIVLGGGWSGSIKDAGFSGEGSWFRDRNNFADTTGVFIFSASANYTFKNSLFVHGSFLYNSAGTTGNAGWGSALIILGNLSPKTLTLARYSLFAQASIPITPLIKADLSSIINPNDGSFFIGPSFDFSLSDNITLLFMSQLFSGNPGTEFGDIGQLYYLRLKWSF